MDFRQNLRATLLYFDLFDYPLTEEELFRFMPEKMSFPEFMALLRGSGLRPSNGYFHLRENGDLAAIRLDREKRAGWMLAASAVVGRLIRLCPFVRGVFLSGSLSKGVNDGSADIDLFIVSSEHRLWICRSILTLFKKSFLLNSKKFLCPNYFVTEKHLEIPERNVFTATELITLRVLYNTPMLKKLIEANRSWILAFYPNFEMKYGKRSGHRSLVQRALELPMNDGYTEKLDYKLMEFYRKSWKHRYPEYTDEQRDFLFRTTPYASKVHPNDYQTRILREYERRLSADGIMRLTRLNG